MYRRHRRVLRSPAPADVWEDEDHGIVVVAFDVRARNYQTLLALAFDRDTFGFRRAGWLSIDLTDDGWRITHKSRDEDDEEAEQVAGA